MGLFDKIDSSNLGFLWNRFLEVTGAVKLSSEGTIQEQLDGKLEKTGDAGNVINTFTAASSRTNLTTGEKLSVSLGKIAKYFADLKTVAFTGKYSDLTGKPTVLTGGSQTTTSNDDGGSNVYTFTKSDGTTLELIVKNGSKGSTGASGAGVTSATQTASSTASGGKNTVTFKNSDGTVIGTVDIYNGAKGDKGDTGSNGTNGSNGARGSLWYSGTAVTGTSTTGTVFSGTGISSALVNDYYLNTSTGYVYKCTTAGNASTAKWTYVGSLKGATGANGTNATTTAEATQSAKGLMSAADKKKLDGIADGANKTTVDSALSSSSTNPVQNKAINSALEAKAVKKTLSTEDLNNVTTPGVYNAGGGNSCINKPSGVDHFGLYVVQRASGSYYTQILIGNDKKQYRRHCESGTWSSWTEDKLTDNNTTYSPASLGNGYGTCTTSEVTAAKVVTLSNYALVTNGTVAVKFTYAVPANATMNINSKGAKNIYYRGAKIVSGVIKAGDIATFIYDGTQYHLLGTDNKEVDLDEIDAAFAEVFG